MNPLLRFEHMLSNYRSLFKSNNFDHFQTLAHVKSMCYFYQVMLECEYGFSDTISHR